MHSAQELPEHGFSLEMPKSEKAVKGKDNGEEKPAEKKLSKKELRERERRLERAPIRKKREYKPFHKSNLAEQIEDPAAAGVRVSPCRRHSDASSTPQPSLSSCRLYLGRQRGRGTRRKRKRSSLPKCLDES